MSRRMPWRSMGSAVLLLAALFVLSTRMAAADDTSGALSLADAEPPAVELSERWQQARERVFALCARSDENLNEADLQTLWESQPRGIDAVIVCLSRYRPQVAALLAQFVDPPSRPDAEGAWQAIGAESEPDGFVRDHLALFLARDWARREWYDEALALLERIPAAEVADPATYHFTLAVCAYTLHRRDEALQALDQLERFSPLAERHRALAAMMRSVLTGLDREGLDGIAHDMRDVRRRLDLGRTEKKVQEIEQDILARLDKIIEKIEQEQNQQQGGGGNSQSSAPAPDSRILGGTGEGKTDSRRLGNKDSWGNLPEKERQQLLQDLGRDFPGHYRDAVEEYFRRLSTESLPR